MTPLQIALGEVSKEPRPKEVVQIIADMETKHGMLHLFRTQHLFLIAPILPATTVGSLEGMIHDQSKQMEKLVNECKSLTYKLDESTLKHK